MVEHTGRIAGASQGDHRVAATCEQYERRKLRRGEYSASVADVAADLEPLLVRPAVITRMVR